MPRARPDTQDRLVDAALALYGEQGYERTTVGQIADRADVTSRTYFRYFPDKREVLFGTEQALREAILDGASRALGERPPYDAVLAGIAAGREVFKERDFVRRRDAVIATSQELRERELGKIASIADALAGLLIQHGSEPPTARMTADAGVSVLIEATRVWLDGDESPFAEIVTRTARKLGEATAVEPAATT